MRKRFRVVAGGIVSIAVAPVVWVRLDRQAHPWTVLEQFGVLGVVVPLLAACFTFGAVYFGLAPADRTGTAQGERAARVGYIGAGLLTLGVFMPFIRIPVVGSLTYFSNGAGDGVVVLGIAAATALAVARRSFAFLWLGGPAVIVLILYVLASVNSARSNLESEDAGLIGGIFASGVQIQWGFAVILLGALLVIAAAHMGAPTRISAGIANLLLGSRSTSQPAADSSTNR